MVEDDRSTVLALRTIFSRKGWNVTVATTVAEAVPLLAQEPQWVILDLMLPGENGDALLRVIRAGKLPIRVAVTTGTEDPQLLQTVARLQPELLLKKPIDLRTLLNAMAN